jgi:S1/P1 nuclease
MQKSKILSCIIILAFLAVPQSSYAWNATGHRMVARIAWDNLDSSVQQKIVALLRQAPSDSCLRQLFPNDGRPLAERQRQFFIAAATWPDVVRPADNNDHRICTKYHQRDWHFVDHFWSGTSGDPNNAPHDLDMEIAEVNAAERLRLFRNLVRSDSIPAKERAIMLGWILHLVGDIHQPLHTSGRVTNFPGESEGDAGGNGFKLGPKLTLHSYWDNIIDRRKPRPANESFSHYIDRLSGDLENRFPLTKFEATLEPGDIDAWVLESLQKAKDDAYPKTLKRQQLPGNDYEKNTFKVSEKSIAESGYRLANLLTQIFGS